MPCLAFFSREQVGRENLVGTENGALLCMMRNLEIERVTLAAMGLGIARCDWMDRHYDEGKAYIKKRFQMDTATTMPALAVRVSRGFTILHRSYKSDTIGHSLRYTAKVICRG